MINLARYKYAINKLVIFVTKYQVRILLKSENILKATEFTNVKQFIKINNTERMLNQNL